MVPICAALLGIQIVLGGCAKNSTDIQTAKVNAGQAAETEVKTTAEETTSGEITTAEETSEAVEAAAKENMGEKEPETEENEETKSKTEKESETEESTEPKSEPELFYEICPVPQSGQEVCHRHLLNDTHTAADLFILFLDSAAEICQHMVYAVECIFPGKRLGNEVCRTRPDCPDNCRIIRL